MEGGGRETTFLMFFSVSRDLYNGGWCPATKVAKNLSEFIQVDTGSLNVIKTMAFGPRTDVAVSAPKQLNGNPLQ